MIHHYGRIFPKIYAAPIQPIGKKQSAQDEETYMDIIGKDLEENAAFRLPKLNLPAINCSDNLVDENTFDLTSNPTANFTSPEDSRILEAVEMQKVRFEQTKNHRVNWFEVKRTANLPQTSNQVKLRYSKIMDKKNRNSRKGQFQAKTPDEPKKYKKVSYISKAEKIQRMAIALAATSQRHYFDRTFFERLPDTIGSTENWKELKRFYFMNIREIKSKLDSRTRQRFLFDGLSCIPLRCKLGGMFLRERQEREKLEKWQKSASRENAKQIWKRTKTAEEPLNQPASSSSNLLWSSPEWKELLRTISKPNVYSTITHAQFWFTIKQQTKIPICKTEFELKKDFFTIIVPTRNEQQDILLPKLGLTPSDHESHVLIFHEILKTDIVYNSITQLLSEGLISETCFDDWFQEFAMKVRDNDESYFWSETEKYEVIRELVCQYILEQI